MPLKLRRAIRRKQEIGIHESLHQVACDFLRIYPKLCTEYSTKLIVRVITIFNNSFHQGIKFIHIFQLTSLVLLMEYFMLALNRD